MKTINRYRVEIVSKQGIIKQESFFKKQKESILAENDRLLVLDNEHFDRVSKRIGDKTEKLLFSVIDSPSVHFYTNDTCFGTKVCYTCYSFKAKKPSTIKKEIKGAVEEKFGSFFDLDLSIIK
jgi:hypothetical protein